MMDGATFYNRVEQLCIEKGITITNLATLVGISTGSPSSWKRGTSPTSATIARIAKHFGVSVDWMYGDTPEQKQIQEKEKILSTMLQTKTVSERKPGETLYNGRTLDIEDYHRIRTLQAGNEGLEKATVYLHGIIEDKDKIIADKDATIAKLHGAEHMRLLEELTRLQESNKNKKPIIFLSHSSRDEGFADAIREFIVGIGIENNQLIYTSHEDHGVPIGYNIYDYLRDGIKRNSLMLILWSDNYLGSPPCLCETGAAWAVRCELVNFFISAKVRDDNNFNKLPKETQTKGIILNGDKHCKRGIEELAEKISFLLGIKPSKQTIEENADKFISKIKSLCDDEMQENTEKRGGRALSA